MLNANQEMLNAFCSVIQVPKFSFSDNEKKLVSLDQGVNSLIGWVFERGESKYSIYFL